MLSAKTEDYLEAVYGVQRETNGPDTPSAAAEMRDVTPPTATSTLGKPGKREPVESADESRERGELADA